MYDRAKWKQAAARATGWPGVVFVGTQAGVAQAFKDCEVPYCDRMVFGLNKAQYQLASTGTVQPKLLAEQLRGRATVY